MTETQRVTAREACRIAFEYQQSGDNDKAATIYRQVLEHAPARAWIEEHGLLPELYEHLIVALHDAGEGERALATFSEAVRAIERDEDPWYDAIYLDGLRRTQGRPTPFKRRQRFRALVEMLRTTSGVPGDVAECGCFRGLSSYLMCSELRRENPAFDGHGYHIFDSFLGLSQPVEQDRIPDDAEQRERLIAMTRAGNFAAPIEAVRSALAGFPAVCYHRGWIPQTFAGLPERQYRFVHVDVDLYEPTRGALEYFHPRLAPGGRIVSDDYNWPGARKAFEEFCASRGIGFELTRHSQACIRRGADASPGET